MTDHLVCTLPPLTPTPSPAPTCTVCSAYSAFSNHPHLLRLSPPAHLVIIGPSPPRCVLTPRPSPVPAALSRDRRRYGTRALPVFGMYSLSLLPDSCQPTCFFFSFYRECAPTAAHSPPPCRHIHLFYYFFFTILPITPTCLPSYLSTKQHIHSLRLHHFISLAVPVLKLAKMHFPTLNPQYGAHYHLKLLGLIHLKDFK